MQLLEWCPGQTLIVEPAARREVWFSAALAKMADGQLWALRPVPAIHRCSRDFHTHGVRGISHEGVFLDANRQPLVEEHDEIEALAILFAKNSLQNNYKINFPTAFCLCSVEGEDKKRLLLAVYQAFTQGMAPGWSEQSSEF